MNTTDLAKQLNIDEGRKNRLYKDSVGRTSGGVGHNFDAKGISEAVIDLMLLEDINDAVVALDRNLPWWRALSDVRQQALANMTFNMGITTILTFKTTLGHIQAGRYEEASKSMLLSKWASQVGARAVRISNQMREG